MNRSRKDTCVQFIASSRFSICAGLMVLALCNGSSAEQEKKIMASRRGATVVDAIQMTRWADQSVFSGGSRDSVGVFSPDGSQFFIVVKKGNLERNTNEYSILLFQTKEAPQQPRPRVLITMSSSTNRDAIKGVKWLNDSKTLIFLGEQVGQRPTIYSLDVRTRFLKRLTNHPTSIGNFDISEDGSTIVYEADSRSIKTRDTDETRRNGIIVTTQYASDLLIGDCNDVQKSGVTYKELFVQQRGRAPVKVPTHDFIRDEFPISVSPNGRYAVLPVYLANVPESWSKYEAGPLRPYVTAKREPGKPSNVMQYMLLETASLRVAPLVNSPISWYNNGFTWIEQGHSVVASGIYLPLDEAGIVDRDVRQQQTFVAEIKVPSGEITEVTDEALKIGGWDEKSRTLSLSGKTAGALPQVYEKADYGRRWALASVQNRATIDGLDVSLAEDLNTPPKIFVTDRRTSRRALLLDLNPQFDQIEFGRVEAVKWKASDGHEVVGGLYLPPNFAPAAKYPLVIQTHGFNKDKFWIDGPYSSAFAAQPLASNGFVVLQVGGSSQPGEDAKYTNTPDEAPRQMAAYEGAIEYLDERGLIDRDRVGIIGFSRTVFYVDYTLTHSKYRFVAATIADGFDGGYLNAVLWGGQRENYSSVIGGPPVGASFALWLRNSPGFNLDKVRAAVRLEFYGSSGPLSGWQWFSGLGELKKPEEFVWLPFGAHVLVKPWERLASQQGNVDWFRFWLKGDEARTQSNSRLYDRWEELRTLRNRSLEAPSGQ
jgi:dipeptidyl aminopeptidase/acylaminoacyl peptidase